uniref:putative nuclease HARBI1 n=1 Tax=Pristiophorus japonicus TaxID=55135 RepID=UPI00398F2463
MCRPRQLKEEKREEEKDQESSQQNALPTSNLPSALLLLALKPGGVYSKTQFTKGVVTQLRQLLQPDLQPRSRVTTALPNALKVTMTLNFFASGFFQSAAEDRANISQFIIHRCIREVNSRKTNREKQDKHACGFAKIVGWRMMQGAIDCTHVALRASCNNAEMFQNCKSYHSFNVHLSCDHAQHILMMNARYPGSSHDVFILHQSGVPTILQPPCQTRGWILGDKGYLFCMWLLTPLRTTRVMLPLGADHQDSQARFRCLDRSGIALQYLPEQVSHFVVGCSMLHNLAIPKPQPLPPGIVGSRLEEDEDKDEEEGQRQAQIPVREHLIRLRFIRLESQIRIAHHFPIIPSLCSGHDSVLLGIKLK